MNDEPLEEVYAYVERAYIRLQAGDLLIRCLETSSLEPIQQMVENLVLAGPKSIGVLREMLAESNQRKLQLKDDLHQVYSNFESTLLDHGVRLEKFKDAGSAVKLNSTIFLKELDQQGIDDPEIQGICLQVMRDSRDLMSSLIGHVRLMDEIEIYLQDWLWGLAILSARQTNDEDVTPKSTP
jgi:hypothetical protein